MTYSVARLKLSRGNSGLDSKEKSRHRANRPSDSSRLKGDKGLRLLFSAALFVAAFQLFLVEPMFAKMVLPLLGGSPSVWNTSILFFQAVLLAGYCYAHWSTRRWTVARQAVVQLLLIAAGVASLPVRQRFGGHPPATGSPVGWLLAALTISLGLPFFVLSTAGPMLQRWFASTRHTAATDPYFLYRASNLGSMAALVAYPLLVEPNMRLAGQGAAWGIGYGLFAGATVAAAVAVRLRPAAAGPAPQAHTGRVPARTKLQWAAWAFVPSSFMLAVTTHITTDLAPIPLLWVLPLAVYLLTFVLAFSPRPRLSLGFIFKIQPAVLLSALVVWLLPEVPAWGIAVDILALFVAGMACHGRLAADRPSAASLTDFYLWVGLGGVLGGAFNVLVAPVVFKTLAEYPLAIILALLCRPSLSNTKRGQRTLISDAAFVLGVGAAALVVGSLARRAALPQTAAIAAAYGV
ncbi:MAG: hypothetical protein ACRDIU_05640, partial [Actinomycetota bacterium]